MEFSGASVFHLSVPFEFSAAADSYAFHVYYSSETVADIHHNPNNETLEGVKLCWKNWKWV